MTQHDKIDTLAAFFRWTDAGLGRKRLQCPRCASALELRIMDDVLEASCPSCGRGPFFERARELEAAGSPGDIGKVLTALGVLAEDEVAAARATMDPAVPATVEDESSGLVGAARALGLFAKSLYLAVDERERRRGVPPELAARPLRDLVGADQLREALEIERSEGGTVGEVVAALALRAQKELLLQLAGDDAQVDLDKVEAPARATELVPAAVAASYLAIPVRLEKDGALAIAVRDPLDFELVDNLKYMTGREIHTIAAAEDALFRALERIYPEKDLREGGPPAGPSDEELREIAEEIAEAGGSGTGSGSGSGTGTATETEVDEEVPDTADMPDEPPGERALNLLLLQAVEDRVEQVILEPLDDAYRARFRRAGRVRDAARLPLVAGEAAVERAMVLAGMDVSRRKQPQDGTIRLSIAGEALEIDAATAPAVLGTVLCLTLSEASFRLLALDALPIVPGDAGLLRGLLALPPGLTVISAPDGEGRSTLLYALLRDVDRAREHVVTLERSVRARVEGAIQLTASDYATLAGAVGRLRPDRVFIDDLLSGPGPLASHAEARLALDLAISGARVVVGVTAPDPVAAVARIAATGLEAAVFLGPLRAMVGLRLVRRICPRCREEIEATGDMQLPLGLGDGPGALKRLSIGIGCWECGGTGYRGRAALTEVFTMDEGVKEALRTLDLAQVRKKAGERGARSLLEKALVALRSGLTSVSQVERLGR